ncbi:MAG: FecR domain-containing protein, partial [Rhodoferax sp.]|nr:FecR domain-containing protein [Rhodoferax sp.]
MTQKYKLKNAVLMMALAAVYPMQSFAAAGVAQFTAGDVSLRRGAGSDPLLKGKDIESGDAIVTGPNGRAQVRFSDGGLVALQPNSQFNISNYADKNDGKQDSFFVDLLRGGMRAVTGLIGKRNHDNYKVTTTTATIGIRGSAFNLAYNPDGSLSVSTELDEIEVCTRAGCVGLKA